MIKPNFKIRNTLILRDIPSTAKHEDVQNLFAGPDCPKVSSLHSDIGDCWFVIFDDDELALKALDFVRTRTFRDKPVKARIKSDNLLRSIFIQEERTDLTARPSLSPPAANFYVPPMTYTNPRGGWTQDPYWDAQTGRLQGNETADRSSYSGYPGRAITAQARLRQDKPFMDGRKSEKINREYGDSKKGRKNRSRRPFPKQGYAKSLQFSTAHFPPLVPVAGPQPSSSGYKKDFIKWSKGELIDIISCTKKVKRPYFPSGCVVALREPLNPALITSALADSEATNRAVLKSSNANPDSFRNELSILEQETRLQTEQNVASPTYAQTLYGWQHGQEEKQ